MTEILHNENEIIRFIRDLIIKEQSKGLKCSIGSILYDPNSLHPTFKITSPISNNTYQITIQQTTTLIDGL